VSHARDYLIIGHPRCGSGFGAKCLTELGISCSHELEPVNSRALSSWAFTLEHKDNDGISPRYGIGGWEWRSNYSFTHTITHLRNPFDAMPSIINENSYDWSLGIRSQYIRSHTGQVISGSALECAILSYLYWNKISLSKADFYFRIESSDDFKSFKSFLSSKGESLTSVDFKSLRKVNSKPNEKAKVSKKDYASVSTDTLRKLGEFCENYEYEYIL